MSKLYLVVTPIGNLKDISLRSLDILKEVEYIACENPNNSLKLLSNYNIIQKKLIQINGIHEFEMSKRAIDILLNGNSIAFISDAGFPCISDPGSILVSLAIQNNIEISVIGGNCAFLNALIGSGISCSSFTFYGFLSSKAGTIKNELLKLKNNLETMIFYESSHRIQSTLNIMYAVFGKRKICIAKELTKLHETYIRCELSENLILTNEQLKGEFVIIVEGNTNIDFDYNNAVEKVNRLVELGLQTKKAVEYIADEYKISKNTLYNLVHKN